MEGDREIEREVLHYNLDVIISYGSLNRTGFHLNAKGKRKIDDNTLVALALAVAQSLPEQKEIIVKLIINLIKN